MRAPEAVDALEQRAAGRCPEQQPRLVEDQRLVTPRVRRGEVERVGGEQVQERVPGPFLRREVGARGRRLGNAHVGDRDARDLLAAGRRRVAARLGEAEPQQSGSSVDRDRAAGVASIVVAGAKALDYLAAGAPARARDGIDRDSDLGLPRGRDRRRKHADQEVEGEVAARLGRPDPQRVEHAAVAVLGSEHRALDVLVAADLCDAVVGLRVEVDHPRPAEKRVVGEQLRGDRLAGSRRAGTEDGGRARRSRRVREVEQDRLARRGQRVADVRTRFGAGRMRGRGHHRSELLDEQVVVVAGRAGRLTGKVGYEQGELVAERSVQANRRVLAAKLLDTLLELFGAGRGNAERDRGPQQRRTVAPRQVPLEVPRGLRAGGRVRGRPMFAVGLFAIDVVGVDDAPPGERKRLLVRHVARAESGVDGEAHRLERREQELGLRSRKRRLLGQRAEDEECLVAVPALGLDAERAALDVDRHLEQAQDVGLERHEREPTGVWRSVDDEGLRSEAVVDGRLGKRAVEASCDEPLEVERAAASAVEVVAHARERGRFRREQELEAPAREGARIAQAEEPPQRRQRGVRRQLADRLGHQAHGEVHVRRPGAARGQRRRLRVEVAGQPLLVRVALVGGVANGRGIRVD